MLEIEADEPAKSIMIEEEVRMRMKESQKHSSQSKLVKDDRMMDFSIPSQDSAPLTSPDTNNAISNEDIQDDEGFAEPICQWKPLGRDDEDCGEGVVCPPCG